MDFIGREDGLKKLVKYQCEICNQEYSTEREALKCERKGKEIALVNIHDNVKFRDDWNGGFGSQWYELQVIGIKGNSHNVTYELGIYYKDGEFEYYSSEEYVYGNEEFKDKCRII